MYKNFKKGNIRFLELFTEGLITTSHGRLEFEFDQRHCVIKNAFFVKYPRNLGANSVMRES